MQSLTEFSLHFVQPAKGHLFDFLSHKKKQIKAPLFYREISSPFSCVLRTFGNCNVAESSHVQL